MSRKIKVDANGKRVIIFSDTHLSDEFDLPKFNFIKEVVQAADQVIINGDFWDSYETNFNDFINSPWKKLFPLLKNKQAIYLYGNHDLKKTSDDNVGLFSVAQADQVMLLGEGCELRVEHGHKVTPSLEDTMPVFFRYRFMLKLGNFLQKWGVSVGKEKFLWIIRSHRNWLARKRAGKISASLDQRQPILVCGHSHLAEYSPDKKYINNGVVRWGLGQYLLVEDGELTLVKERY